MKNKFYIMTALVISLTGCSSIEDGTLPRSYNPCCNRSEGSCVACRI